MIDAATLQKWQYEDQGYVHVPSVFSAEEVATLREAGEFALHSASMESRPWEGPWLQSASYADPATRYRLLVVKKLCECSPEWKSAAESSALMTIVEGLIGPARLEQSMLVMKPPKVGQPFPVHQDSAYYGQVYAKYCVCVVHLDATNHENGALRFLPGGHKQGHIPHRLDGKPYLPMDTYPIDDTVEVHAKAGDVVCFNIHTPHASYPNTTDTARMTVRLGYVPRN